MKTKAACEATGLTRKTLLFYEEKGLFTPLKHWSNGREFREYTEENVQELKNIATLRKAWFTIDEIKRMKEDPEQIGEILENYYQWLLAQQEELSALLDAAVCIRRDCVSTRDQLIAVLEKPTKTLSLPPADIEPRFRYLDEIEERPAQVLKQAVFEREKGAGRLQVVANRTGNVPYGPIDMVEQFRFQECKDDQENGTVPSRADHDSHIMRVIKGIFMGMAFFAGFMLIVNWFGSPEMQLKYGSYWPWVWAVVFVAGAVLRGILEFLTWNTTQNK